MTIEPSEEAKRLLSPENLREALADFEAQAGDPKSPNGMRSHTTTNGCRQPCNQFVFAAAQAIAPSHHALVAPGTWAMPRSLS